jgi:hypothetical protein
LAADPDRGELRAPLAHRRQQRRRAPVVALWLLRVARDHEDLAHVGGREVPEDLVEVLDAPDQPRRDVRHDGIP